MKLEIRGDKELSAQLDRLTGPQMRKAASAGVRAAMKPVRMEARRLTPSQSGRLRASIGTLVRASRRRGSVTGRVGFRRDFTYTSTSKQRMVSGAGKTREKGLARGLLGDKKQVNVYAAVVEFGASRNGRVRRSDGGARMLNLAIEKNRTRAVGDVANAIRAHLQKTK